MPDNPPDLYHVPRIYEGIEYLLKNDPVFSKLGVNPVELKRPYYGPGFPGLVRIVVGQQVSTLAADAMWRKLVDELPNITPNSILILNRDELRDLGLSHQKARYIRELAQAMNDKTFDPLALEELSDEQIYEDIMKLKGFGPWSAEIYLMFCLARPDVWPAGDLGIQEGLRKYLKAKERPTAAETKKEGERFKPYRTAASLLLWYMKAMD